MKAMNKDNPKYNDCIERESQLYERKGDFRTPFMRDYNRIIFTTAYRRLKHKTQVFFAPDNDHICTRAEHVNLVESISYTIAHQLGLNTELTRAISAGHDLGHAPFGHGGEKILSSLSIKHGLEPFWHEKNSLHLIDDLCLLEDDQHIEHNLDLTYAVRDGIIAHCGEVNQRRIKPRDEKIDLKAFKSPGLYQPYTLEGCVVKISDKIAYLARDIEDAWNLHILNEEDMKSLIEEINAVVPELFKAINNGTVVNYFIQDVIHNSTEDYIGLSDEAFEIMKIFMKFNYQKIYEIKKVKIHTQYVQLILESLFSFLYEYGQHENFVLDLKKDAERYPLIINHYLKWLTRYSTLLHDERYQNHIVYDFENDSLALEKSIIDYLSGMTDHFIIDAFDELLAYR